MTKMKSKIGSILQIAAIIVVSIIVTPWVLAGGYLKDSETV